MSTNNFDDISSAPRKVSIKDLANQEILRRVEELETISKELKKRLSQEQLEKKNRKLQEYERLTRNTNLLEFLDGCHTHFQLRIRASFDFIRTPKASPSKKLISTSINETPNPDLTNVDLRPRPERIRKWNNFLSEQKTVWDELMQANISTERHFFPLCHLNYLGDYNLDDDIWVYWKSTMRVHKYQTDSIISHVSHIIENISQNPTIRKSFRLRELIFTMNESETLAPERVSKKLQESPTIRPHNSSADDIKAIFRRPDFDQFCAYNYDSSPSNFNRDFHWSSFQSIFILEYKGAQRLKLEYIRQGLHEMDLGEMVRYGQNDSLREKCTQLVATIITRTFAYMIQAGLEYGCIWTGEATIFLRIPEDPSTVLYHLSVPKSDVGKTTGLSEKSDSNNRLHLTAVGLMLAFTLQATRAQPRTNSWRLKAMRRLNKWNVAYGDLLDSISDIYDTSSQSPIDPGSGLDEMQVFHESPIRSQSQVTSTSLRCSEAQDAPHDESLKALSLEAPSQSTQSWSNSVSQDGNDSPGIPGNPRRETTTNPTNLHSTQRKPVIQYCTHKCLRGLKFGGLLDEACPNSKEHGTLYHQISRSEFLEMIRRQLAENMNDDFKAIGFPGSRGAPLSVRLASHGYTVFAKCSPESFAPCLLYEAKVYDRLESIQGIHVPVHLGNIDLEQPYIMNGFVMLFHVMFLSYGGSPVCKDTPAKDTPAITQQVEEAFKKIHQLNVLHRDVASRNILVDHDTKQAVVTDFERSKLIGVRDDPVNTSPQQKKRKKSSESGDEQICEFELSATSPQRKKRKVTPTDVSSSPESIMDEDSLEESFSNEMLVLQEKLEDAFYECE